MKLKCQQTRKKTCKGTCGHAEVINDPFLSSKSLFCPQSQAKEFLDFLYLNVAILEILQNIKRSDENEFIDLNCGIQVTKVGLSSD